MRSKNFKIFAVAAVLIASIPLAAVLIYAATGQGNNRNGNIEDMFTEPITPMETQQPADTETNTPEPFTPIPGSTPHEDPVQTPPETPSDTPPATASPIINISESDAILAAQLDLIAERYRCVAVSMAVYESDGKFYTYQYGMANISAGQAVDEDTKFRVASLSKIVPAICALSLAESGVIDIDTDISTYLGYTVRNPNYPDTPITARMLMQHTSSIYDSDDFLTSRGRYSADTSTQELLDSGTSFRNRKPGTGFQYTNFGTSVLGAVCESASGKLMDTLARDILFTPLGIDAAFSAALLQDTSNIATIYNSNHTVSRTVQTQLDIGSTGVLGRDHHLVQGNLAISAVDYAKIMAMLCNGGVLDGVRILSERSVREIHNADVRGAAYMQGLCVRFGEGAFLEDDVYWHTGSAYGEFTQFIYSTETGRAVVVFTTGTAGTRTANGMVEACNELSKPVW